MREIKFRYKVKDRKELVYDSNEDFHYLANNRSVITFGMGGMLFVEDEQQYIGLKDKKKKEIYEGDLVKFRSKDNVFIRIDYSNRSEGKEKPPEYIISEVIFSVGAFWFDGMYGYEGEEIGFDKVEVIGNIHENPELIK